MMELYIDGKRCDVERIERIPIDFDIAKLREVEGERSGRVVEVTLPATAANSAILGLSRDIYTTSRFNDEHHTAEIRRDGVKIFAGTVYLRKTSIAKGGGGAYEIRICEGGAEWIESVVYGKLSDLEIPFSGRLSLPTISNSWEGDSAVRFLPVRRSEKRYGSNPYLLPVEVVMLTDDYHPFISIAEMVKAMFANVGYTLRSNFFDSDFGGSLYMSGDYTRSDATVAKERCDFFARRSTPVSAKADSTGRVFASMSFAEHTLGALVDTADPTAYDSEGVQMVETFNTLNAFSRLSNGGICFTPASSVKAGFLIHLEYTSDYKILSRERLTGFDVVEGLNNLRVEFPLVNNYEDKRNALSSNWHYCAFVFDHIEGRRYRLVASHEDGTTSEIGEWARRCESLYTGDKLPISVTLYYCDEQSAEWMLYEEDWALYPGFVTEEGRVDVQLDIRIPPQDVAAGACYELDKIWFGGAEMGMELTLGIGTTMRPYFTNVPGFGSALHFEDIAPRNISQLTLLEALAEMFNLTFYTDRECREVYIEPLESLYDGGEVIDINSYIDRGSAIELSDTGLDRPQNHIFAYKDGDAASHKFNLEEETELGRWSFHNPLYGTTQSVRRLGSKLFTTTLNTQKVFGFAPSASLMQVGDVGLNDEGIDMAFTPHIVCYRGLRELPEDECWIVNGRLTRYPYATFFDDEVNLCFEERNGVKGLASYHLPQLIREREGQRVTLDLCLTTAEMAHILTESGPKPSVRKSFRFDIEGESSLYRLVRIEKWDCGSGVVRCTFERLLKD